ncbi:MAG: sulfite exporter TauE/SafE family protein [Phycisphaeraceae bacterium]
MFELWVVVTIAVVGLFAGGLGGLLGIGGSTVMIPALVVLFGQGEALPGLAGAFPHLNQHLYQAAAMIVNVFVAVPATFRHVRAKAVVWPVVYRMLPIALVAMMLGVWISNLPIFRGSDGPVLLGRVLAAFLVYVIIVNFIRLFRTPRPVDAPVDLTYATWPRTSTAGGIMGLFGGLLGIGGGAIGVPLQQMLLKLRLRNCIANSAALMTLTAGLGAFYKNATLDQHSLALGDSLLVAALLAPTGMIGGYLGARFTHRIPVRLLRAVLVVFLSIAAWRLAGL